jgi:hypothetical protein
MSAGISLRQNLSPALDSLIPLCYIAGGTAKYAKTQNKATVLRFVAHYCLYFLFVPG